MLVGCSKLGHRGKPGPDASSSAPAATATGKATDATIAASGSAAAAPASPAYTPTASDAAAHAPVVEAGTVAADPLEDAKRTLASIEAIVARSATRDPAHPGDSDVKARCEALEASKPKLAADSDPDTKAYLEKLGRTCSLDVPLLTAADALDQLRFATSQASRRLVCNLAEQDLGKATAHKPDDKRVRALDARYRSACR